MLVQYGGKNVLIDTTPDFRAQALRAGIGRVDAILFTHAHADHILGLDDVRPLNYHQKMSIPAYGTEETLDIIRRVFRYAFNPDPSSQSSAPRVDLHAITEEPFDLFGLRVIPIPLMHGRGATLGFRFGDAAYLTDHSDIPEGSKALLRNLDVLFLDALRHRPHPTHSTVEQSLASVANWRRGARFSRTSATTCRTRRPRPPFRPTSGWRTMACSSKCHFRRPGFQYKCESPVP